MAKLTAAQQRYLDEIKAKPGRKYNGRARRPVEALAAAGLITYEYDLIPQAKGNGMQFAESFECWPTKPGLCGAGVEPDFSKDEFGYDLSD